MLTKNAAMKGVSKDRIIYFIYSWRSIRGAHS